jgi:putative transposase
MKENLIHYRTSVCNINYHMVWSVKYRRKILTSEVETYLKTLVQQIAEEKGGVLFSSSNVENVIISTVL